METTLKTEFCLQSKESKYFTLIRGPALHILLRSELIRRAAIAHTTAGRNVSVSGKDGGER